MKEEQGEHQVAICGLYCGACTLYRARNDGLQDRLKEVYDVLSKREPVKMEELYCDGCLAGERLSPYCRTCEIRACVASKQGVTRCSDCSDFPCAKIIAFNNDGMAHHAEVLEKIKHQREIGVAEWLQEEYERWRCEFCGLSMDWYARSCHRCKTKQPNKLPRQAKAKK